MSSDLVDLYGIADLLGVSKQRAQQLSRMPSFPEPVAVLVIGKVWSRQAVTLWDQTRPKRPGRPPKNG